MSYNWYWDISLITAALKLPLHDFTQTHDEFLNNANNHWSILWNLESLKKKQRRNLSTCTWGFLHHGTCPFQTVFFFLSPTIHRDGENWESTMNDILNYLLMSAHFHALLMRQLKLNVSLSRNVWNRIWPMNEQNRALINCPLL